MSIDLGFAQLDVGGGRLLSLVDVPGHERFVRTMVAGATGVDMFLLVVAADDGVMPQTAEHAAVLRALGVRDGVVAVTKADLADPGRAREEVRELVAAEVPVVACSARTGMGVEEVRAALRHVARARPGRPDRRRARRSCTSTARSRCTAPARSSPARCGRARCRRRRPRDPAARRAARARARVQVHDTAARARGGRSARGGEPGGRARRRGPPRRRRRVRRGRSRARVDPRRRARPRRRDRARRAPRSTTARARRRPASPSAATGAGSCAASGR